MARKNALGYMHQLGSHEIIMPTTAPARRRPMIARTRMAAHTHVWHETTVPQDHNSEQSRGEATADYLIFTTQDCIPRADFIATHQRYAVKVRF
jgi:hypothetical protein